MRQSFLETLRLIRSDMQMRCDYEHKRLTWLRMLRFCVYSASASIIAYRLQAFFYHNHMKPIAWLIALLNNVICIVRIDSTARIGPRFLLLHASCVTIGPNVVMGSDCVLAHQNTITASPFFNADTSRCAAPVIGNHLFMGAGAVINGSVNLGDHIKISANALVDQDFSDHAILFGVPAKNVAKHGS